MSSFGQTYVNHPMKDKFIKWQCHTRQMMMRDNQGRPDAAIMPEVYLAGQDASLGALITILNKLPTYSQTPEMLHMARKTNDPAQARSQAIQFFSATYYQKFRQLLFTKLLKGVSFNIFLYLCSRQLVDTKFNSILLGALMN